MPDGIISISKGVLMIRPDNQPNRFSVRFLLVMLVISVVTNCILVVKLRYPGIIQKIRYAFISAPKIQSGDHLLGKADAKYTIIEYADLQCPYCAGFHEAMRSAMKETDDIRWVFRHFPLPGHPLAAKAAEAAECAGEQGQFWEYSDAVFNFKSELTEPAFRTIAGGLGLDVDAFNSCLVSGKYQAVVANQHSGGLKLKIEGTPTFFINGKRYAGSMSSENLLKLLGVNPADKRKADKTNITGSVPTEEPSGTDRAAKAMRTSGKKGSAGQLNDRKKSVIPVGSVPPAEDSHVAAPLVGRPAEPVLQDACSEVKRPTDTDSQAQFCK